MMTTIASDVIKKSIMSNYQIPPTRAYRDSKLRNREKAFLLEILGLESGGDKAEMPRFVTEIDLDPDQWDEYAIQQLYQRNRMVYKRLNVHKRTSLAYWWAEFWEEKCQIIGGQVSEAEMIRHVSEEGFKLTE